jgi:hypothetical protein
MELDVVVVHRADLRFDPRKIMKLGVEVDGM